MKRGVAYVILALILGVFIGLFFLGEELPFAENSQAPTAIKQQAATPPEGQDAKDATPETILSDGSASGGGGSSGGGGDSIIPSCPTKQISYSLKSFDEEFSCLEYNLNGCSKLQANCSVDVYNLDEEYAGTFVMSFGLIEIPSNELSRIEDSRHLGIEEFAEFGAVFNLENEEGISENLECDFLTKTIPQKPDC